jgi:hypothetical protein
VYIRIVVDLRRLVIRTQQRDSTSPGFGDRYVEISFSCFSLFLSLAIRRKIAGGASFYKKRRSEKRSNDQKKKKTLSMLQAKYKQADQSNCRDKSKRLGHQRVRYYVSSKNRGLEPFREGDMEREEKFWNLKGH